MPILDLMHSRPSINNLFLSYVGVDTSIVTVFSFIFVFMFPIGATTVTSLLSTIKLSKAYLATHLIRLTHSSAV